MRLKCMNMISMTKPFGAAIMVVQPRCGSYSPSPSRSTEVITPSKAVSIPPHCPSAAEMIALTDLLYRDVSIWR